MSYRNAITTDRTVPIRNLLADIVGTKNIRTKIVRVNGKVVTKSVSIKKKFKKK
jgi:hypothetical protein